ncbi:Oxidoreductase-like protein [Arthrobacter sp. 9AX]|uniref:Gfo/Idh/MocA family protein n=1 Tax=Arthrobacter sp. 9AX TaxID=2653131 RepID=UPI0012F181A2|nr:Gfo/Idh/MocA family oxidoreductase [Arthrobacter sp. 9AX]VXC14523.1 Oxidoreductase-like protein [Arthrobacter sp. 9AX]
MTDQIGYAIVGLGYGGTRCEMLQQTPNSRLAAVVDRNEDRAREYGEKYSVPWFTNTEDVLSRDDVDVVGIYTPSGLHLETALHVAAAGKHLLLTKPMEVSLERCDEIIRACESAGVELFGEFYLRYHPDNWRLKRAIDQGHLGQPILGEFGFKCFRPAAYYTADGAWRQTWELNGGGVVMNQALHAIDMLTWCLGEVASVQAVTGTYSHEIPVEDTAAAIFTMKSGATAVLVGTTTFQTTSGMDDVYGGGFTTRAEVNGQRGSLSLIDDEIKMEKLEQGHLGEYPGRPANVFDDVSSSLLGLTQKSPTLARARESRRVVEIAQAIYQSAELKLPVDPGQSEGLNQPAGNRR